MDRAIGVLNAGSSSLKGAFYPVDQGAGEDAAPLFDPVDQRAGEDAAPLFDPVDQRAGEDAPLWRREIELGPDAPDHATALAGLLDDFAKRHADCELVAVGHRIVHGGRRFDAPTRVDDAVLAEIERLVPLAPLHQPHGLAAIRALRAQRPDLLQVACFDTAFHRSQDPRSERLPLPAALHEAGVQRYGFHGLSYESIVAQLPGMLGETAEGRVVIAHLGNGASIAALRGRRCVATTMGMTPLGGLMMGTRSGAIDPGVLLHLMRAEGYDETRLTRLLQDESGLLGVSGLSHDMRVLLASDLPAARFAVDLFVQRLVQEIASMAASLDGIDALVFTGGIGERAAPVREAACTRLAWLGIELDPAANRAHGPRLSRPGSRVSAWVIATDEEGVIARHTRRILSETAPED